MVRKSKLKLSVWQFLAIGYFIVIVVGTVLLVLPFSAQNGKATSFIDALFTATSAACVTGLTPFVTAEHWSVFGQVVILLLIQTGGLGFMTFVSSLFLLFKRELGVYERNVLLTAAGGGKLSGLTSLIRRIFIGTVVFETLGACLLCISFVPDFGAKGVYFALFHSVSAFCNAGFDLLGASSLSGYATDPVVVLTLSALIVLGGLGFLVWGDVVDSKCNPKKFQLNTKIVLLITAVLLVSSTALYMLFEWDASLKGYNFGEKLLVCIFDAATARTAGFYVTNPGDLSDSGYLLTVSLMFIGGASGSTAGGIKVGTFAVIIMGMMCVFRGHRDINIGKKRIEYTLLSQALAIFTAFLTIVMFATITICAIEPDEVAEMKSVLFECVSAMGTVGLSINLTPTLSVASKIILILLMYTGRVGILTLALALGKKRTTAAVRKPVDTLLIG